MLVTRKKNLVRNGQAKSDFKDSQDNEVSTAKWSLGGLIVQIRKLM